MSMNRSNIENFLRSLDKAQLNRVWEDTYRNRRDGNGMRIYVSRKPQTRHEKLADLLSLPVSIFSKTATQIIERTDRSVERLRNYYTEAVNEPETGNRYKSMFPTFEDTLDRNGDPRQSTTVRYARALLDELHNSTANAA